MSPVNLNLPPLSSSPIPNFPELKDQVLLGQAQDDHVSSQILDKNPSCDSHERSLTIELSSRAQDLKIESALFHGKSNDLCQLLPSSSSSCPQNNGVDSGFNHGYKPMSNHEELGDKIVIDIMNKSDHKNSKKWKPSKVRIMQKMMGISKHLHKGEDHHNKLQHSLKQGKNNSNNNSSNGATRVCFDCHTTTTPLWRSGPQGPKSLCNACGIRQRKARRAAMAAAAATTGFFAANGTSPPIAPTKPSKHKVHEEMREKDVENHLQSHPLPLKKRGKTIDVDKCGFRSSNNEDYVTSNYYYSKKRAYPRDEEEGAILLMALSCSLACSS